MLNNIMTLKSGLESPKVIETSASQKLGCGAVSYSPSIVTMALSCIVYEI